jgi:chromosome segregation ATPase
MDVEKHGGVYPHAGGRLTTTEILRRAGKSEAYLRKTDQPSLIELKQRVQDFVDQANKLIAQGARSIRRNVTDKVREAEAELKLVKQAYSQAEQEYNDTLKKLEIAEKTIEELRGQNTALRKELSDKTVVELYPAHG